MRKAKKTLNKKLVVYMLFSLIFLIVFLFSKFTGYVTNETILTDNITTDFNGTFIHNETIININESNLTVENNLTEIIPIEDIYVSSIEKDEQLYAEVGKPVRWVKHVEFESEKENPEIDIPDYARNISVVKIENGNEIRIENIKINGIKPNDITGNIILSVEKIDLFKLLKGLFSFTGYATADENDFKKVTINDKIKKVYIYYETPAPELKEKKLNDFSKEVIISSQFNYKDIITYTKIQETKQDGIKLYRINNGSKEETRIIDYIDENGNGMIDKIKWITPHLSDQTFLIELRILNVYSHPFVGGNWTVSFNTTGVANLTISAIQETSYTEIPDDENTIDDLEFIELKCGNIILNPEKILNENKLVSLFYPNYNCNETGEFIVKVLTSGSHTQEFRFGDLTELAYNYAWASDNCGIDTESTDKVVFRRCGVRDENGFYKIESELWIDNKTTIGAVSEVSIDIYGIGGGITDSLINFTDLVYINGETGDYDCCNAVDNGVNEDCGGVLNTQCGLGAGNSRCNYANETINQTFCVNSQTNINEYEFVKFNVSIPNSYDPDCLNFTLTNCNDYSASGDFLGCVNNSGTAMTIGQNFTLTLGGNGCQADNPPGLNLLNPINNRYLNTSTIEFMINVSDGTHIYNISLWHNISGSFAINQSKDLRFYEYPYDKDRTAWYHLNNDTAVGENQTYFYDYADRHINNLSMFSANPPVSISEGKFHNASHFGNITGNQMAVNSNPSVEFNNTNMSIEIWWKPGTSGAGNNNRQIVAKWQGSVNSYALGYQNANNNKVWCGFRVSGSTLIPVSSTAVSNSNKWYHIVCVYNGTTAAIYVDGVREAISHGIGFVQNSSAKLSIGSYSDGGGGANGTLDEVALYNYSLSAVQILDHNNTVKTAYTSSFNISNIADGNYLWNAQAFDNQTQDNFGTNNYTVTVDTTYPTINLTFPYNNTVNTTTNIIDFYFNLTEINPANATLIINYVNNVTITSGLNPGLINNITISLPNGAYNWSINVTDKANNMNGSLVFNFSVNVVANTIPALRNYTANQTTVYNGTLINFSVDITDDNGLSGYVFSINQTGVFVNSSFINLNGATGVNVSNITRITTVGGTNVSWQFIVNDTNGAINVSSIQSFIVNTLDNVPAVNLIYPPPGYNLTSNNVSFNCTATDDNNLVNITLWGNWTGTFHANQTFNTPGLANASLFNKYLPDGNYIWNCQAYDNATQSTFFSSNYTFSILQCNPPASGTWNVNDTIVCRNRTIVIDKNVTIHFGGNLTIINVNLSLNGSYADGVSNVEIRNNGSFYVITSNISSVGNKCSGTTTDCSGYDEASCIAVGNPPCNWVDGLQLCVSTCNACNTYTVQSSCTTCECTWGDNFYGIQSRRGSNLSVYNSSIEQAGWASSLNKRGFEINTSSEVYYTNFSDVWQGFFFYYGGNKINNTRIALRGTAGAVVYYDDVKASDNLINKNNFTQGGIVNINSSNSSFINNHIIETSLSNTYLILGKATFNNTIKENKILSQSVGSNSLGGTNHTIYNNTFLGTIGLTLDAFDYGVLKNNIINGTSTSGSFGLILKNSDNNLFVGNKYSSFNTSTGGAKAILNLTASEENKFIDDIIASTNYLAAVNDTLLNPGGNVYFYNVTFNNSKVAWSPGATGLLRVLWYLNVSVNDTNGNLINSANVTAWNVTSNETFSFLTNANGQIPRQNVTEYEQNRSYTLYFTNYTVNTTSGTFDINTKQLNITRTSFLFITMNNAPNISQPSVTPSPAYRNNSLNCTTIPFDYQAATLNVTFLWSKNNVTNNSYDYSANVANFTTVGTGRLVNPLMKYDNWTCQSYAYDGFDVSVFRNSTALQVSNSPPNQTSLIEPLNGNDTIFNRTVNFRWVNGSDADNDTLTYNLLVNTSSGGYLVNITTTDSNYVSNTLFVVDTVHYWKVCVSDEGLYGQCSPVFNFTVRSSVALTLISDNTSFGGLNPNDQDDTTDDNPGPLKIQNDGNVLTNVNISLADLGLWTSPGYQAPTSKFRYKINNNTGEAGAFNWSGSQTMFANIPISNETALALLNYSDNIDSARVDIEITVPSDEPSGFKSSSLLFTGWIGE